MAWSCCLVWLQQHQPSPFPDIQTLVNSLIRELGQGELRAGRQISPSPVAPTDASEVHLQILFTSCGGSGGSESQDKKAEECRWWEPWGHPCHQQGHLPPWGITTGSGQSHSASSSVDIHETMVPECGTDGLAASWVGVSPATVTAPHVGLARIEEFSFFFSSGFDRSHMVWVGGGGGRVTW